MKSELLDIANIAMQIRLHVQLHIPLKITFMFYVRSFQY